MPVILIAHINLGLLIDYKSIFSSTLVFRQTKLQQWKGKKQKKPPRRNQWRATIMNKINNPDM